LLDEIVDRIWDRYDSALIERIGMPEDDAPAPADWFDDELPF